MTTAAKMVFARVIFVITVAFGIASALLGVRGAQLDNRIQSLLAKLEEEQQEVLAQATAEIQEGEKPLVLERRNLASYFVCDEASPFFACRGGFNYFMGVIPADEVAARKSILETSAELEDASARRARLERPGGLDKDVVRVVLSLVVVLAALYIILSRRFPEASEKWAFGTIGLILGYWLNTAP